MTLETEVTQNHVEACKKLNPSVDGLNPNF